MSNRRETIERILGTPPDILSKAETLAAEAEISSGYVIGLIAEAILAERERCAKIAENAAAKRDSFTVNGDRLKGHSGDDIFISADKIDEAIAAIRSPA